MKKLYNIIIMVTKKNLELLRIMVPYCEKNIDVKKIFVVANKKLEKEINKINNVFFFDEDKVYNGMTFNAVFDLLCKIIGNGNRTGWYLQQFLKMAWCYINDDEEYIVIDADTIPLNYISFKESGKYLFTSKIEYHPPYFNTIKNIFSDEIYKKANFSFIAEHMMFNKNIMRELICNIEAKDNLKGNYFWEKILYSIDKNDIEHSGFSEFETYGNYMLINYPDMMSIRKLRTQREAGVLLGAIPTKEQLEWAGKDYDIISIEEKAYKKTFVIFLTKNKFFRLFFSMYSIAHLRNKIRTLYRKLFNKNNIIVEK